MIEILFVKICDSTTVVCEYIIGLDFNRLSVVRDRVVVVAHCAICAAADSVGSGQISASFPARLYHCHTAADYLIWHCPGFDVTPGSLLSRLCAGRSR